MKLKSIKIKYLEDDSSRCCHLPFVDTKSLFFAIGYFESNHYDCIIESITIVEFDNITHKEIELSSLNLI